MLLVRRVCWELSSFARCDPRWDEEIQVHWVPWGILVTLPLDSWDSDFSFSIWSWSTLLAGFHASFGSLVWNSGKHWLSSQHSSQFSHSVVSDSSWPHGLQPTRLLLPWDFPSKSTGVGCHRLLQIDIYTYTIDTFPILLLLFRISLLWCSLGHILDSTLMITQLFFTSVHSVTHII